MRGDHSDRPREMAGVGSPRIQAASMIACRSIACEMARRTTVELAAAVHRQRCRGIIDDRPFYPIDIGLPWQEVVRIALEDRLHIRLIAFQEEGASTNGALWFLQPAK